MGLHYHSQIPSGDAIYSGPEYCLLAPEMCMYIEPYFQSKFVIDDFTFKLEMCQCDMDAPTGIAKLEYGTY